MGEAASGLEGAQERLSTVLEATRLFAEATTEYERLLDVVAHTLKTRIGDAGVVFLLDESRLALRAVSIQATDATGVSDMNEWFATTPVPLDEEPVWRRVIETGEAALSRHIEHEGRTNTRLKQALLDRRLGLQSLLLVALRTRARSVGVLALARYLPGSPPYTRSDQELAQALADQAALAIQNAQLYVALREARRAAEQSEERARGSEEMYRFLFDSSPMATAVFDVTSSRILEANAAALELYGYEHDEFSSLHLDAMRAPEERERIARAVRAAGDAPMQGSAVHIRKDGRRIMIEGKSTLISYRGSPARLVAIVDRTEQHATERARREVEERLQRTLDMMLEGCAILDHDMRALYLNEAAARHGRLPKEQMLGRTPMELYPGFEQTGVYRLLRRCLVNRTPVHGEQPMTTQDGQVVWFELSISPIPEGLICLTIDITERVKHATERETLEEQLRQAQRMDALGRLAGGIAHDFNNILLVILGYCEPLLADSASDDPRRDDLLEIQQAATRAAELTKQLLTFSRQQLVEPKILDLNEVLSAMQSMLRRVLMENISLELQLDPALGKVRADRGNIEQVIMNLVVNARDAMAEGGKLVLATANVSLDEAFVSTHAGTTPGPYVRLSVSDTGIGMAKETRLRIFDPFFTTKNPGKGTGLGLATVFGIVQQSRGSVWVNSDPGKGATFDVYLPRAEEPGATVTHFAESAKAPGGSETILLVEDENAVRIVVQRTLERAGYHVIAVQEPSQALDLARDAERRIDLLLTDVVMPQLSGPALAEQLRAQRSALRILYMSGYADGTGSAHPLLESGAPFLQKPFTAQLLIRKVRAVLDVP